MTNFGEKIKKSKLENLNKDSINTIEILKTSDSNSTSLATCSDLDISLINVSTNTRKSLFSVPNSSQDELSCLKSYSNDHLFASHSRHVLIFDVNQLKQINRLKFNSDTINCMELGSVNNSQVLTLGDDSGEIKIVDLRVNNGVPSLTLKNTLKGHKNICYCLKYHPTRPYELFSGSFDCSFIKWDTRNGKAKLAASKDLTPIVNQLVECTGVHPMTPSFIHTLFFSPPSNEPQFDSMLLCGLENGLCLAFDPNSLMLCAFKQIGFNQAVTQMAEFESTSKIKSELLVDGEKQHQHQDENEKKSNKSLIATGGDSNQIEFIYLDSTNLSEETSDKSSSDNTERDDLEQLPLRIERVDSLKLDHGFKINCLKYSSNGNKRRLYVSDTTQHLTIYDFNEVCFL